MEARFKLLKQKYMYLISYLSREHDNYDGKVTINYFTVLTYLSAARLISDLEYVHQKSEAAGYEASEGSYFGNPKTYAILYSEELDISPTELKELKIPIYEPKRTTGANKQEKEGYTLYCR
jgi:hypothetical protein